MPRRAPAVIPYQLLYCDTGPPLVLSQDKCPSHKISFCQIPRRARAAGSAAATVATAIASLDLSGWLLSTAHYSCVMRMSKGEKKGLKFERLDVLLSFISTRPVSCVFLPCVLRSAHGVVFSRSLHGNQWNLPRKKTPASDT